MSGDEPSANKTLSGVTLTDLRPHRAMGERRGSLLVIAGAPADLGAHCLIDGEALVGREFGDLKLRDGRVSRRHVRVAEVEGGYVVEDVGSTNGSTLNGQVLTSACALADGDKLYLGNTIIKFTLVDDTEATYLQRMERLAGSDPLTGLHAKHRFDSMLDEALRAARASDEPLWLMMMDLDGLKAINDAHGHRMGAHTIAVVGRRIGRLLLGRGEACRFGGDEFSAYLPQASAEEALACAESIRLVVCSEGVTLDAVHQV